MAWVKKFLTLLVSKIAGVVLRMFHIIYFLPRRLGRLARHLVIPWQTLFAKGISDFRWSDVISWAIDLFFYCFDVIGTMELYETVIDIIKFNTRPLTPREKSIAKDIFGKTVYLDRVRIDSWSFLGCRHFRFAYVSGFVINSWGPMRDDILIHELVHAWQYQSVGLVYVPWALRAQYSSEGYNYGGLDALHRTLLSNGLLQDFNLEQQADLVADFYRIRIGERPRWSDATIEDLHTYGHLIQGAFMS